MAQQGQYPLNGRTPVGTDTATGVVTGATADIPLSDIAALVPIATDDTVGTVKPDGTTITIDLDGTITALSGAGVVASVVGGTGITVDSTDPANPIVNADNNGTVTSVALTAPSQFAVAGSPITDDGTLAVTWNTQTAATVLAGPATGSAAAPTFRALLGTDLPQATTSLFGAVKPDGTTITISSGVITAVSGGSGTVSSVGLAAPSQFAVTGSPVTGTGTLTFGWNTQSTNTVLAGPNGSTGAPTFRTLAPADLPVATSSALGAVKPDGTTIAVTAGAISVPTATTGAKGIVQPDGTTITISGGVISAVSGGSGTVTSVGLALPSTILSVSGSPVTGTGTLTGTLQSQTANTVWAGAVSGGSATPAFRALVPADLPVATTSALGAVKPDGNKIAVATGAISIAFRGARVYQSGTLSYAGSTPIGFDTVDYDTGIGGTNFWTVAHPTRFTAPVTGYYRVLAQMCISFTTLVANAAISEFIGVNGVFTTLTPTNTFQASLSTGQNIVSFPLETVLKLTAADYVEFQSGGTPTGTTTFANRCWLAIEYLGS